VAMNQHLGVNKTYHKVLSHCLARMLQGIVDPVMCVKWLIYQTENTESPADTHTSF